MLPKSKQYAAAAKQAREFISQPLDATRSVYENAENDANHLPSVCRVCLAMDVTMYDILEKLSAMYEQVTGVEINSEDKLPQQLCWECVARLSSANRFIQKALKTQWILSKKVTKSRFITISDIESIDKTQHELKSSLGRKIHVNDYDFIFPEELDVTSSCCNVLISKLPGHNYSKDNSEIDCNDEKEIFIKEECTSEEDPIKTEQVVAVKEAHNYTAVYKGSGIDDQEGDTDNENTNITLKDQSIGFKENISYEDYHEDYDESSVISQEGRQVDKPSKVCEGIKQSHIKRNTSLSSLRNGIKLPFGCKELIVLVQDIGLSKTNASCKQHNVLAQSTENEVIKYGTQGRETLESIHATTYENIETKDLNIRKLDDETVSTGINANINSHFKLKDNESLKYKDKSTLRRHIESVSTKSIVFNCSHCFYKTQFKDNLKRHINAIHTKTTVFNCSHCLYKTHNKGNLKRHINAIHTKTTVFICHHCSFKFYDKGTLRRHIVSVCTKSTVFNCPHCFYKAHVKANLKRHINAVHTKTSVFNCSHCSFKTSNKSSLTSHIIRSLHTKSTVFNCSYCSYKTLKKSNLNKHINSIHTKTTVFNCSHCHYKTHNKGNLKTHINAIHTKTSPFICSHCSFKTYDKSTLRIHIVSVCTKSTVFNCSHCFYKTHLKGNLKRHINAIHTK